MPHRPGQPSKSFIDGKVPSDYKFDHIKYNHEAYEEFENAVFKD